MNTVTFGMVVVAAFAISYTLVSSPEKKPALATETATTIEPTTVPIVKYQPPTAADIYYSTPRPDGWREREQRRNDMQRRIDRPVECSMQVLRTRSTARYITSCN